MLLFPQRLKRCHRGMQSEKAVEIKHRLLRDIDGRPHRVVAGFAVWNNDVEAVCGSALKDHDQALGANAGISRAKCSAGQEAGQGGSSDYGQRAVAEKHSTSDCHKTCFQLSALSF